MTTMQIDRAVVEQVLEALGLAKLNGKAGLHSAEIGEIADAITALSAALAQQAEPVQEPAYKVKVAGRWHDTEPLAPAFSLPDGEHLLYTAPPQRKQAEPLNLADPAVQKRLATQWGYVPAAQAEPVEPVAWRWGYRSVTTGEMDWRGYVEIAAHPNLRSPEIIIKPLYAAPPQRTMVPLTEEEIKTAFHAARNAKLGASQDNSRHRLSVIEIARAVEKASWEKNHGQA